MESDQSTVQVESGQKRKRTRLSHACNLCRQRKVRCDEQQPSCRNCEVAGVQCVTSDPRRPEAEASRKRAGVTGGNGPPTFVPSSNEGLTQRLQELEQEVRRLQNDARTSLPSPSATTIVQRENPMPTSWSQPVAHDQLRVHSSSLEVASDIQPLSIDSPNEAHLALDNKKRKWMGPSSVQVLTQWLDLYSSIHGSGQPLSASFRFGMIHAEEIELPFLPQTPKFPATGETKLYIDAFFSNVAPILPILDREDFFAQVERLSWLSKESSDEEFGKSILPVDRPVLTTIYAVLSIGIDESHGMSTDLGKTYLDAAISLYAHLIAMPYLSSVQAILLIVMALRLRCKDGAAWNLVAQGIRIAISLGLHRRDRSEELETKIWWSAFCLESIMAFESGRPLMIPSDRNLQPAVSNSQPARLDGTPVHFDYLEVMTRLALVQRRICSELFSRQSQGNNNLMAVTGTLDQELLYWAETLPLEIRPGQDLFCSDPDSRFACFLALQYHQTLIMVHRAALLLSTTIFQRYLNQSNLTSRTKQRIRSGESICVGAARNIINLLHTGAHQRRVGGDLTPALLASYVLAIYLLKHPDTWGARADLALLEATTRRLETRYLERGQSREFVKMLGDLVRLVVKRVSDSDFSSSPVNDERANTFSPINRPSSARLSDIDMQAGNIMDDLWPRVMGEDLAFTTMLENELGEHDISYQYFGLPP